MNEKIYDMWDGILLCAGASSMSFILTTDRDLQYGIMLLVFLTIYTVKSWKEANS